MSAVLRRVGEEPTPVELCFLDKGEEFIVIGLGLPRIADDEVGPKRRIGAHPSDRVDPLQISTAVTPPSHRSHQRSRHVLEGKVEVGNGAISHHRDECIAQFGWIQVEQPDPLDALRDGLIEGDYRFGADPLVPAK